MIIDMLIAIFVTLLNALTSKLDTVATLPQIVGFNIDGALVTAVGEARTLFTTFWPFTVVLEGFVFLMGYYVLKAGLKMFLGSRVPANN